MASTKTTYARGYLREQPTPLSSGEGLVEIVTTADTALSASGHAGILEPRRLSRSDVVPGTAWPLRVLHVINSLGLGGTERGVLKVIEGLDPELFDQRVCAIRGAGSELGEHPALRGRILTAAKREGSGFEFLVFRLAALFRAYKPHIVHSRNWGGIEAILASRLAGVPSVVHSEHGYELDMMSGLPLRRRLIRRGFYSMCDALFAVSNELRDYHSRQGWISSERIRVIPNGVDTGLFAPNPELRCRLREQFGLSSNSVVLGTVGRFVPIKAQGTLLRAAEQLLAHGLNLHVLLVGGGAELDKLRDYASRSTVLRDRVTFLGASLAVHELYQVMDIFVLPSIREGMSNTLLEAMASGLPCVATAVGSNSDLIADGQWGFLFSPGDIVGLAGRLEELVRQSELRTSFAIAARRQAVACYSLDRMLAAYAGLYSELAQNSGVIVRN